MSRLKYINEFLIHCRLVIIRSSRRRTVWATSHHYISFKLNLVPEPCLKVIFLYLIVFSLHFYENSTVFLYILKLYVVACCYHFDSAWTLYIFMWNIYVFSTRCNTHSWYPVCPCNRKVQRKYYTTHNTWHTSANILEHMLICGTGSVWKTP
jgi:hypothetical protein